jgi:transposase-like protein
MPSHLEPAFGYQKDKFEQTCDNCGARFEVVVPGQKGHEESEGYCCPECQKEFTVRASNSPTVQLIAPRTDGKTESYETDSAKE